MATPFIANDTIASFVDHRPSFSCLFAGSVFDVRSNPRSFSLIAAASIRREVSAKHDYSSGGDAGNEQIVEIVDNSRGPFPPFSNTDTKRF